MTSINARSPSNTASTSSTANSSKTTQTSAPPPADHDVETLPSPSTPSTPSTRRASPEEIAAAKSAAANVTDEASAEDAGVKLLRLPNADFAATIKDIASEPGRLEKILEKAPPQVKESVQRRLVRSGVLQPAVTPPSTPVPPKAPQPPAAPVVLKDDASLPPVLRQLAADENTAKLEPWKKEQAAYREAYATAVDNTKSIAELRALGPMQAPNAPANQPSTTGAIGGPYNAQYEKARGTDVVDHEMMTRVADKGRELSGKPVAGLSFKVAGEAMFTLSDVSKFGVDVEVGRSASGRTETGITGHLGAGGAQVGVNDKGEFEGEVEVGDYKVAIDKDGVAIDVKSDGPPTPGSSKTGHDKKGDDSATALGGVVVGKDKVGAKGGMGGTEVGVAFSKEKGFEAELTMGVVGGKGAFNVDQMSYGMKVGKKIDGGDYQVELAVEAEMSLQGVTKADRDAFVSASDIGFFTKPSPEVLKTPWAKLPDDVKKAFENQLWTEADWNKARDLAAPLKR
ncbi:MAG TPA: hypothetical protein VGF99_01860 [Myxococcota bacterium]